jgi:hypothetical protein
LTRPTCTGATDAPTSARAGGFGVLGMPWRLTIEITLRQHKSTQLTLVSPEFRHWPHVMVVAPATTMLMGKKTRRLRAGGWVDLPGSSMRRTPRCGLPRRDMICSLSTPSVAAWSPRCAQRRAGRCAVSIPLNMQLL